MVKDFLDKNNVLYENIDVSIDETKAKEMVDKTGQMGVPVIIITKDDGGEEIIIGFQESKLRNILEIK